MNLLTASALLFFLISPNILADSLSIPQGKGKCPTFTIQVEKGWHLKSDRKAGDRWLLLNQKDKSVMRFDYKLPNTDQKQLPAVETIEIIVGGLKVEKFTVTTSFPEAGKKASEGLITSYNYMDGPLQGLVVMSEEYSTSSNLDKKIEKILGTIKLKQ